MSDQSTTNEPRKETGNAPVITRWDGSVFAKVWENTSANGGVYFNVTVGKLYTDPKTGENRETNNLQKSDLPRMQFVAGEAYRDIGQLQQSFKLGNEPEKEQRWLKAPDVSAKPPQQAQNEGTPQIENGRAQSPEM